MDSNQLAAGSEGARYLEYVGVTGAAVRYYELQIKVVQWRGRPPGPRGRCGTNIYNIFRETVTKLWVLWILQLDYNLWLLERVTMLRSLRGTLRSASFADTICFEKVYVCLLCCERFGHIVFEKLTLDGQLLWCVGDILDGALCGGVDASLLLAQVHEMVEANSWSCGSIKRCLKICRMHLLRKLCGR